MPFLVMVLHDYRVLWTTTEYWQFQLGQSAHDVYNPSGRRNSCNSNQYSDPVEGRKADPNFHQYASVWTRLYRERVVIDSVG